MKYQIRAYSTKDKNIHDIKDYKFENNELTMISTYKDIVLSLHDTEYVIIDSATLNSLLGGQSYNSNYNNDNNYSGTSKSKYKKDRNSGVDL